MPSVIDCVCLNKLFLPQSCPRRAAYTDSLAVSSTSGLELFFCFLNLSFPSEPLPFRFCIYLPSEASKTKVPLAPEPVLPAPAHRAARRLDRLVPDPPRGGCCPRRAPPPPPPPPPPRPRPRLTSPLSPRRSPRVLVASSAAGAGTRSRTQQGEAEVMGGGGRADCDGFGGPAWAS